MTVKKSTLRPRRSTGADNLPRALVAWFSGEREPAPEVAIPNMSPARLRALRDMPPHALSRTERRALGLPVEPIHSAPWEALIYPDYELLPERWLLWRSAHPDARPPAGWEWLDDLTSPRHPPAAQLDQARKLSHRAK